MPAEGYVLADSVRVRGIYSTALIRLFLDNNIRIAEPSATTRERFNLREHGESVSPDLDVYDRLDRQGVNVIGDQGSLEQLSKLLHLAFDDAVFRWRLSAYGEATGSPDAEANLHDTLMRSSISRPLRRARLSVEFPSLSKAKLDNLRARVTPTLDGHHYYKACGGRISAMLEMAEKLLEKDCPRKEVEALFHETVAGEFPDEGSRINIEHVKISGSIFDLGVAEITDFDHKKGQIQFLRNLTGKGVYDGLRIQKDSGDYAVTEVELGQWSFRTRYFSRDSRHKGTYINLNTPVELYPTGIRYVDLETDICVWPDGRIQKVDEEKLENMIQEGYVSEKLGQIVREKTEEIMNSLETGIEEVTF